MKILVTGGAGYIGSNLCNRLQSQGHDVSCLDIDLSQEFELNPHITKIQHDVLKEFDDLPVYDCIYHLAALPRIPLSFKNPEKTIDVNCNGTFNVLKYAKKIGAKLVFTSTSSAYSSPFLNPYTYSKYLAEQHCMFFQKAYDMKVFITRLFNVYGGNHPRHTKKACMMGIFEHQKLHGDQLTIYGNGLQRRDFTHIDDICDGLVKILQVQWYSDVIDLGFGNNHSVSEIAGMFRPREIMYKPARRGEGGDTLANLEATKKILGWQPQIGIQSYIEGFLRENELP